MSRVRSIVVVCAVFLASACGGFHIRTPAAARPVVISGFEVVYSPEIPGDRQQVLNRLRLPQEMSLALRQAYPAGQGPLVRVIITQFRSGRWGPTRMHAVAQVMGPGGQVLNQIDVDSTTTVGSSRPDMIQRVSQDITNQIAQRL